MTVDAVDIDLPVDTKKSRLNREPAPVAGFDPDDITTVDEKVATFWGLYPDGSIDASDIEQVGADSWRVTAYVWKNATNPHPDANGSATRTVELDGHVSAQFALETAQSVAISRALRFLGIRPA